MFGLYIAGAGMVWGGMVIVSLVDVPKTIRYSSYAINLFYLILMVFGALKF